MTGSLIIPAASLAGPVERADELVLAMRSPGIDGADSWAEAGRKAVRLHMARTITRLPGVLAGEDPEDVHAMRVASRRTRAAWQVFGDGFEREPMLRHRQDLRALGGRLGVVRDLDVHLGILDSYVGRRGSRSRKALLPLWNAWSIERLERHRELVAFLTGTVFVAFVHEAEAFLDTGAVAGTRRGRSAAQVRARMPSKAWAAYGEVRAFEDRLLVEGGPDLGVLHQLRIAAKWLRYTLEFAREPVGDAATLLIEPVIGLQDHLGDQHDLHVTATLAREFLRGAGGLSRGEATHAERFAADLERRAEALGGSFPRAWAGVGSTRYRARLGRAMARL
jgi:CHAD domain-containing protein